MDSIAFGLTLPDGRGLYARSESGINDYDCNVWAFRIDLHSGNTMKVVMSYDGTTLKVIITDTSTSASVTQSYVVDIPSLVGGPTAFMPSKPSCTRSTSTTGSLSAAVRGTSSTGDSLAPNSRIKLGNIIITASRTSVETNFDRFAVSCVSPEYSL
jgi:hypothetical protein